MGWNSTHTPHGEFQFNTTGNLSLNCGGDNQGVGNVQLGTSSATHETYTLQYDDVTAGQVNPGLPLGYSKLFQFASHYYNGGTISSTMPGFRGEAYNTGGDVGITFYNIVPTQQGGAGTNKPLVGGIVSAKMHTNGWQFSHIGGLTNATFLQPTVVTNAGAGNSTGTVTMDANASDTAMLITLATGSSPTASATVFTVTFGAAYSTAPHVIMTPASATDEILTGQAVVYVDAANVSTSAFHTTVGTSALTGSTTYKWWVQVIQ
jgi:hypothetical protein